MQAAVVAAEYVAKVLVESRCKRSEQGVACTHTYCTCSCVKYYFPGFGERNTHEHRSNLLAILIIYKLQQLVNFHLRAALLSCLYGGRKVNDAVDHALRLYKDVVDGIKSVPLLPTSRCDTLLSLDSVRLSPVNRFFRFHADDVGCKPGGKASL